VTLPDDLLGCAERIAQTPPADDALHRAVTSRAYYAAFHAARLFHNSLAIPGHVGAANGVHEQLIAQLSNPGLSPSNQRHTLSKTLGRLMRGIVAMRVDADYQIDRPCSKASEALELARQILQSTKNGSPPSQ
jgi:uncharacterized protein (UPF0332 family)